MAGVDHHDLAGEVGVGDEAVVAVGDLLALAARFGLAQRVELDKGLVADDPVRRQADVTLEVDHGAFDGRIEDATLGAGVEAEQVELDLQRQDVVAAERGHAQIE